MNSLEKSSRAVLLMLPLIWVQEVHCQTSATPVIYKHVDESGRVTYSNQPIKGAAVVELAPLMVMSSGTPNTPRPVNATANPATVISPQATPSGALNAPSAQAVPIAQVPVPTFRDPPTTTTVGNADDAPALTNGMPPASPVDAFAQPKIRVLPVPTSAMVATPSPSAPPVEPAPRPSSTRPTGMADTISTPAKAGQTPAMMVQQRREEVRRRILEGEIEAENELLAEARDALAREQKKSAALRALREAISTSDRPAPATVGRKAEPDDNQTSRGLVERHFQRVRDLQDQVAMHDQNLVDLRSQLAAVGKSNSANAARATSSPLKPVALVSTTPPGRKSP